MISSDQPVDPDGLGSKESEVLELDGVSVMAVDTTPPAKVEETSLYCFIV